MKTMKKLLCMTLAILMVLSLSTQIFAEGEDDNQTGDTGTGTGETGTTPSQLEKLPEGTLAIHFNQLSKDATITAYRIFDAYGDSNSVGTEIGDGDAVTYKLTSTWEGFFWDPDTDATVEQLTCPENLVDLTPKASTDDTQKPDEEEEPDEEQEPGENQDPVEPPVVDEVVSSQDKSGKADQYISELYNGEEGRSALVEFADKAANYAENVKDPEVEEGAEKVTTVYSITVSDRDRENGYVKVSLPAGYYLVNVTKQADETTTNRSGAMLVNVPSARSTNMWIKNEKPVADKQVEDAVDGDKGDTAAYSVGDTIDFTVTVKVPDYRDFRNGAYYFAFVDTLSEGLTFKDGSIVLEYTESNGNKGEKELQKGDSSVTITSVVDDKGTTDTADDENVTTVTIVVTNIMDLKIGSDLKVSYSATLNNKAKLEDPNTNKAKVVFSTNPDAVDNDNDPSTPPTQPTDPGDIEESKEDETKVYTTQINVDKYWMNNGVKTSLADAWFSLYKEVTVEGQGETTSRELVELIELSTDGTKYRVATSEDSDKDKVTQFKTVASGVENALDDVIIQGLGEGTYYLEEVTAPYGYNQLSDPVKIEITYDYPNKEGSQEPDTTQDKVFSYTVDGKANDATINVENKKGTVLPETGSIGTIGLTALGAAVVFFGITAGKKKEKQ